MSLHERPKAWFEPVSAFWEGQCFFLHLLLDVPSLGVRRSGMITRPRPVHFITSANEHTRAHFDVFGRHNNSTAHLRTSLAGRVTLHTFLASVFIVLYASMIFFPPSSEATLKRVARSIGMAVIVVVIGVYGNMQKSWILIVR